MSGKQALQLGSFTLLTGLGATLVAGLLAWVFSTTLENKVTFAPLTVAIDRLNTTVDKMDTTNAMQHRLVLKRLDAVNTKIRVNETKLFRVMQDCEENGNDIHKCQVAHGVK